MQGFWAILADLSAFGKLSIKLKALSCKVFSFIQQTLHKGSIPYNPRPLHNTNRRTEDIKAIIRQEMPEILQYREMRDDYDSSVGALGAIWGPHSEESFWDALKAILEYSFGVQVINVTE
jgi:hypothetical protein